jgi:hypothetical protein
MVQPLQSYAKSKDTPFKFSRMDDKQRDEILSHSEKINNFRQERMHVESGQRFPEASQRSGESRAPGPMTSESRSRMPSGTIERTRPGGSAESQKPSERRESSQREGLGSRSSSERMSFPRSPVTGRDSQGLFRKSTPSRPEREERFERGGSRESSGGRGGRR